MSPCAPAPSRLRIGSGRVAESGAGPKAAWLDRAARAGLAVPNAVLIGEADIAEQVELDGPLAVRSAFSVEDGTQRSMAGRFRSELGVQADDLAAAVERVRDSGEPSMRRDVLVMTMVDPVAAGVAFTETSYQHDLVEWTEGLADRVIGGQQAARRLSLGKLRRFEPSRPAGWPGRLQRLLRDIRRHLGSADWDVEWADDGSTCWLIQLRPVTAPVRRDEVFTIANHAEILPPLPSRFMSTLMVSQAHELFAFYRRIDPEQPTERPFLEEFAGRPYINLSLLEDLLISLGLPTRLLADSLGGEIDRSEPTRPVRILMRCPTLIRLGRAQTGAHRSAMRTRAEISALAAEERDSVSATIDALGRVYVLLVTEMSSLATAMAPQVSLLRRLGLLEGHLARQRTPGTRLLDDLLPLTVMAGRDPELAESLAAGRAPETGAAARLWQRWLERHGHRGVFESDIARPRHAERPEPILTAIGRLRPSPGGPSRGVGGWVSLPVWWTAARAMRAREELRSEAMAAFAVLRSELLDRAAAAGIEPDELWDLTVDEARRIDAGWRPDAAHRAARVAEIEHLAGYRLPDLVSRSTDLEQFRDADRTVPAAELVRGRGLTRGRVVGTALVAHEPPDRVPEGPVVLVARSIDAGWVASFGQVAAVAVEIGGDLSHGSIILRELGLPAVTNLRGITQMVASGDTVELDAERGLLRLLPPG